MTPERQGGAEHEICADGPRPWQGEDHLEPCSGRRAGRRRGTPVVFFLGQRDFFYLGIVGVVWLLVLAAAAVVGVYSVFHEKGLYFRCQWPEEHPKVDQ